MSDVRLKDITWGGPVRVDYQHEVWSIARETAVETKTQVVGNMVSSAETTSLQFLDGGVSDTRGFFDSSSGMRIHGEFANVYMLYKLGLDPQKLMKRDDLPGLEALEEIIAQQKANRDTEAGGPPREGVAAVASTEDEFFAAVLRVNKGDVRGAILFDESVLGKMQHAGLFALPVFNPFGPTAQTVSLANFTGDWSRGNVYLLRRILHPFREPYVQVLAYPGRGGEPNLSQIARDLTRFLANNGMQPATKEWATPLLLTVPSGVVTTPLLEDTELAGQVKLGLK